MAEVHLTEQQQAVIENRGGTLLVSAAAGSGKTQVLVNRMIRRIVDEGKNINEFLIITFTNAAASELRMKISDAIGGELQKNPGSRHLIRQQNLLQLSQISTVHAFCGALIRQYGYLLDVSSDYRVMEESESKELLQAQLDQVLEDAYEKAEPGFRLLSDTLGAGRTDETLSKLLFDMFQKLQSQPDPQRWLRTLKNSIPEGTELTQTIWGQILVENARQELKWLISRYNWAIEAMQGDVLLEKQYLPCYEMQRNCLQEMVTVLDGPWDEIAPRLTMDYPRIAVRGYPDQEFLNLIKAVRSDGKELLKDLQKVFVRPAAELILEQNTLAPALDAMCALLSELDRRFSAEKRQKNVLDFADQEHLAIRLLIRPESGHPTDVARDTAARFTEIMVDEYQDSNRVQELIFTAIAAGKDENRFLVGDVKQSIYGFRQAEPEMFLEKYHSYKSGADAQGNEPRCLVLSKNFRSRPEILEAVNHVFSALMSEKVGGMRYGSEEQLYPGMDDYPETGNPHVEFHMLTLTKQEEGSEESKTQREAAWVIRRIAAMLQEQTLIRDKGTMRPVKPDDIAILFRTRDSIAVYSRMLQQAGIPVASEGGDKLFETQEVRVLMNLLRVLTNPHQDIPLLSVLCSPIFRISNQQLAQIRSSSRALYLYDAMRECREPWCTQTYEMLEQLREKADTMSADQFIWVLLHETGMLTLYSAMGNGQNRCENLLTIYQLAQSSGEYLYLYQLIRRLERAAQTALTAAGGSSGVILTTIHQSKGLEYPVVFLADLSHKFNFKDLSENVLFDSDLGFGAKITDSELRIRYPGVCFSALRQRQHDKFLSEELRVLYVAMTRPKDYLIMTYAGQYTESAMCRLCPGAGMPSEPWAVSGAACLGDWVLLAALGRIEADALFEICGKPNCSLTASAMPWLISCETVEHFDIPMYDGMQETEEPAEPPNPENLTAYLRWKDPHVAATVTPSKLTATQMKGREKDAEAADGAGASAQLPQLRRPEFILETKSLTPTERGTAVHQFLQFSDFAACQTIADVQSEKVRLANHQFMTEQQLDAVDPKKIVNLFQLDIGRRLLRAPELIREFKFSILVDAKQYYPDAADEQILLQGVVDAAINEPDGLTIVDFKTDRVTEQTFLERAEHYRGQLTAYRDTLERIFQKPVKETILYFLELGRTVTL